MTAALPKSIRLRTLNALLASMVGTAPQLRGDIDAVLRVFEADDETDPRLTATDLAAAAAQIFRLLSPARPGPVVAVLDHRMEPFDPLWAGERVASSLATTGDAADVLFWVVGLQDQYLAGSRARSTRWRAAYDEAVDTVQGLVASQAGRRRVTVVVL